MAGRNGALRWYYTCPGRGVWYGGLDRRALVSKVRSLRWLEDLKESQRLTSREERRKEEILEIFRELYDISARNPKPTVFPPWRPSW